MDFKIDITNPEAITYITNEIGYTILGGIRLQKVVRYDKVENQWGLQAR